MMCGHGTHDLSYVIGTSLKSVGIPQSAPIGYKASKRGSVASVFLSYARADLKKVREIVEKLRVEALDVWWDQDIPASAEWDPTIEAQLADAKVVIVCWSKHSAGSENVRAEA